ncbi:hypothetical protein GCM10010218_05640 [Streptomyces mashuensis]|uniref:DUF2637 domain-containing protein n=1 Tax=Streptomyces mashuensis TaxID=33904 RepID=A0A919AWY3_9ACTN|nr:DUF2637 domain-containing protein [Streptomyces mashuensis]GHF27531.1 hypothetical protein GCM10010218_05640 [Streptomyces mashuensis]
MTHAHPTTAEVGGWDRAAILLLGAAGCAISYDALQQMATAIHIRGLLTYLFPLLVDGFIGYGVRALIVTRTAPWRARLYIWVLFGTATAASIWANALHAVRLNQINHVSGAGLRLGDLTVGVLSTLAPLALAGAVHLYILITRHQHAVGASWRGPVRPDHSTGGDRSADTVRTHLSDDTDGPVRTQASADTDQWTADADQSTEQEHAASRPDRTARSGPRHSGDSGAASGPVRTAGGPRTTTGSGRQSRHPAPDRERARPHPQDEVASPMFPVGRADRSARAKGPTDAPPAAGDQTPGGPSTGSADRSAADQRTSTPSAGQPADQEAGTSPQERSAPLSAVDDGRWTGSAADREGADRSAPGPHDGDGDEQDLEQLLPIARAAVRREGRINRTVVRGGLREQQIQVSNQRLGLILQRLRAEAA